ncbi:hypothetical protein [Haloarcula argentinensis]|uniref:Uncharacterized protein n=1 Tax=Haloarcula argentinensis TaxID=43776 RepID=A0A830FI63_HALAR|nr:hypothetical protein [Haloarcula argentinensis]GGM52595.1 hypothetical protein GCM10009006_37210 [Haloarcula argentinensis]
MSARLERVDDRIAWASVKVVLDLKPVPDDEQRVDTANPREHQLPGRRHVSILDESHLAELRGWVSLLADDGALKEVLVQPAGRVFADLCFDLRVRCPAGAGAALCFGGHQAHLLSRV